MEEGATVQGMWWSLEDGNSPQFIVCKKTGTSELNSADKLSEQEIDPPLEPQESDAVLLTPGF